MIYDHIRNIENYMGISPALDVGLTFIAHADKSLPEGMTNITDGVKAIVSECQSKEVNKNGFEAHRRFIDIQMPLQGSERVAYLPLTELNETKPYSKDNDIAFYSSDVKPLELTIGNGFFAVFFPQDGHQPQLCVNQPETIKKLVLKVKCH